MGVTESTLRRVVRTAAGSALLTGAYGFLALVGVFGSVSCPAESAGGDGASGQGAERSETVTATDTARDCPGGLDYLLDGAGGAPELFFWPTVLLGFTVLGVVAAWTGHRRLTWATVAVGVVVSGVGFLSVGRYFVFPTLFLFVAATSLTVEARRGTDGSRPTSR